MSIVRSVEKEPQFFSVKKPITFGGKAYRPSICYKITSGIFDTVKMLAEVGDAVMYENAVRFVSGRVRETPAPVIVEPSIVPPVTEASIAVAETNGGVKLSAQGSSRKKSSSVSPDAASEAAEEFREIEGK